MNLVRWDPFKEIAEVSDRLKNIFSGTLPRRVGDKEALTLVDWVPVVDISETEKEYLIQAELPELKKEEVKVSVQDGVLTLQGERHQEKEEKGKKVHRIERSYGCFERSFTIPGDADENQVSAEFKEGVLNIHLPKSEKLKPKTVEVKVT
ncbi:MAG: Hsp20/alpha crystallin family protein [Nitrospirae bacterium]|nr:Hsp20/alpha crystallin family protein [Nitrospirota bacterium]MBI3352803.1 Hsp20/alpha crystallin family protein [Nitrospirota bacterium]